MSILPIALSVPSSAGTTDDGTDPATADAFAALMAALLPQPGVVPVPVDAGAASGAGPAPVAAAPAPALTTALATLLAVPMVTEDASNGTAAPSAPAMTAADAAVAMTGAGIPADQPISVPTPSAGAVPAPDWATPGGGDAGAEAVSAGPAVASAVTPAVVPPVTDARPPAGDAVIDLPAQTAATTDAEAPGVATESTALAAPAAPKHPTGAKVEAVRDADVRTDLPVMVTETNAATAAPAVTTAAATAGEEDSTDDIAVDATGSVSHATPAATTEAAAPAAPPAPAVRPAPVPPHQQIVSVIMPLRRHGNGSYHVSLQLRPDDLGPVALDVHLHQGTVELHLHSENEHTRDLLTAHLGDLRNELEQAGLRAGTMDVSDRQSPRRDSAPASAIATGTPSTGVAVDASTPITVAPPVSVPSDSLDVKL